MYIRMAEPTSHANDQLNKSSTDRMREEINIPVAQQVKKKIISES